MGSGSKKEVEVEEEYMNEEEGDMDVETQRAAPLEVVRVGGECLPRRKMWIYLTLPRTCKPVVVGSLWILPAPQRQVAPRRGSRGRRHLAELLAPASITIG